MQRVSANGVNRLSVKVTQCENAFADGVFASTYWMKGIRRSRRISYSVQIDEQEVGWIQFADPFGTKLAKPLQCFDIGAALELSRGYFEDQAPKNTESCSIAMALRMAPNDWFTRYGVVKRIAIVYQDLDVGQKACVYRALGFKPFAYCVRARHHSKSKRGGSTGSKVVWARHLRVANGMHYETELPPSGFFFSNTR